MARPRIRSESCFLSAPTTPARSVVASVLGVTGTNRSVRRDSAITSSSTEQSSSATRPSSAPRSISTMRPLARRISPREIPRSAASISMASSTEANAARKVFHRRRGQGVPRGGHGGAGEHETLGMVAGVAADGRREIPKP